MIGNGTKERWELTNVGAYGWKQKQLVMFLCLTIVCGELVSHVNLWNYLTADSAKINELVLRFSWTRLHFPLSSAPNVFESFSFTFVAEESKYRIQFAKPTHVCKGLIFPPWRPLSNSSTLFWRDALYSPFRRFNLVKLHSNWRWSPLISNVLLFSILYPIWPNGPTMLFPPAGLPASACCGSSSPFP